MGVDPLQGYMMLKEVEKMMREKGDAEENIRRVLRQLAFMTQGIEIKHPNNPKAPGFGSAESLGCTPRMLYPVLPHSNLELLLEKAGAYLAMWGRDKTNGWLLTHPIRKLILSRNPNRNFREKIGKKGFALKNVKARAATKLTQKK